MRCIPNHIAYFFLIYLTLIAKINAQNECSSGSSCVNIQECHRLFTLFRSNTNTDAERDLLTSSECQKGKTNQYKVCCENLPFDCTTPDKHPGTCTHLYKCPHLKTLVSLPDPHFQHVTEYLDKSLDACRDVIPNTVCCNDIRPSVTPNINAESILPNEECKYIKTSDRIFGGNVAGLKQYPWLALLEYRYPIAAKNLKLSCGGSLFSSKYVLTAAHCVSNKQRKLVSVRLGEFDIAKDVDCDSDVCKEPIESIYVEKIIVHPEYSGSNLYFNDIALIRLERPVRFTDDISPLCLPKTDITVNLANTKAKFEIAGWGKTENESQSEKKLYVSIPYVDLNKCEQEYSRLKFNIKLRNSQLCAGGEAGKDSCSGDSGGPLVKLSEDGYYEHIGIVSYGSTKCGTENLPAVYTKVFSYLDWIKKEIEL